MAAGTTIYHNPNCGTSRKVLGMLRDSGNEPLVIEYLKTPPTKAELTGLLDQNGHDPAPAAAPQRHSIRRTRP